MQPVHVDYSHSDTFATTILAPRDGSVKDRTCHAILFDQATLKAHLTMGFGPAGLHVETRIHATRFEQPHRGSDIWRGDCIQVGIDPGLERTPRRLGASVLLLGFTEVDGRPYTHAWKRGDDGAPGPVNLPFEFANRGGEQVYRVLVPWNFLAPLTRDHGDSLGFSLSVNSHAGKEPRYFTWGGGIIGRQDASQFNIVIFDRHDLGIGAELVNPEPADSYDSSHTVHLDLLVPVTDPRAESIDLSIVRAGCELVPQHRQPVRPGENRLRIALPVEQLADGANDLTVSVVAQPGGRTLLSRSLRLVRESAGASVARLLCDRVEWSRPELADSDFAADYRAGRVEPAALGFVRYLRRRPTPHLGYTKDYVATLRAHATPEFRTKAAANIAALLGTGFLGGAHPDGRGTLLMVRPEVLQVAATRAHFELFAWNLTANRNDWHRAAHHTHVNVLRFLQAAWPLEECTDESLIPVLGFLAVTQAAGWAGAKTWDEVSHGTAHNWWIYEFNGNWKGSLLFPELAGFAKFQAFFPENFEREIRLLFQSDGFSLEVSTSYHIGTVDGFYDLARLAQLNGLPLSAAFYERLHAAAEVEWKLMQPDGNYPAFGDCFSHGPHVLERARSLAAMANIPEAKYLAETLDPTWKSPFGKMLVESLNYPSIGEDLRPAYDKLPARPPATLDTALPRSGYYAMRQDWSAHADYAAIEASARGLTYTSHGHSAIFDLKLCARGRAILVGNGKGPDDHGSPPRRWRVSTAAHSAATADGEDPVPLRAIYRFAREVTPVVIDWESTPGSAYFHGVHEAYSNKPNPVGSAHRKLFYLRGKYWILIDRFCSGVTDAPHTYRQHFQVGVPSQLDDGGRCITEGAGGNLLFVPVAGATGLAAKTPCPFPLDDYPCPDQLTYTQAGAGHGLLITLLVPFVDGTPPEVSAKLLAVHCDDRILSRHEATGLEIQFGGERHIYVNLHTHWNLPWECGGRPGHRMVFHSAAS